MIEDTTESLEISDRRIARRFQLNLPIVCDGQPGTSINISSTGIRYFSTEHRNEGSRSYLKVYFGKNRVNLVGETVWSEGLGTGAVIGASFAAGSDLDRLRRYLERCDWKTPV